MPLEIQTESTLTDRYQTTIPEPIRKVLGLKKRDRLCYTIDSDGRVTIAKVDRVDNDPILENFLTFLERDLKQNPQNLTEIDSTLYDRISSLVEGVEIDLDAPLSDEDE